jgi:hypothetical protein
MKLKPGQTARYECGSCMVEFDLTHEPKATTPNLARGIPAREPRMCPFCGADLPPPVDDPEDE